MAIINRDPFSRTETHRAEVTEQQEEKAYDIHCAEADNEKADIFNCGWGVNIEGLWISIASKTSKGILVTNVDFSTEPPTVEHNWGD
jgi:hypothetical protein